MTRTATFPDGRTITLSRPDQSAILRYVEKLRRKQEGPASRELLMTCSVREEEALEGSQYTHTREVLGAYPAAARPVASQLADWAAGGVKVTEADDRLTATFTDGSAVTLRAPTYEAWQDYRDGIGNKRKRLFECISELILACDIERDGTVQKALVEHPFAVTTLFHHLHKLAGATAEVSIDYDMAG